MGCQISKQHKKNKSIKSHSTCIEKSQEQNEAPQCVICYRDDRINLRRCQDCRQNFCIFCAISWRRHKNQCPMKCNPKTWNIDLKLTEIEKKEIKQRQHQNQLILYQTIQRFLPDFGQEFNSRIPIQIPSGYASMSESSSLSHINEDIREQDITIDDQQEQNPIHRVGFIQQQQRLSSVQQGSLNNNININQLLRQYLWRNNSNYNDSFENLNVDECNRYNPNNHLPVIISQQTNTMSDIHYSNHPISR